MTQMTFNQPLADLLATAASQTEWCYLFKQALNSNRRVLGLRNGVPFRNCALTGAIQSSNGKIVGMGYASDMTVATAANLSTGTSVLRFTSGIYSAEGPLGLPGSGRMFTMPVNPTTSNGFAVHGIEISAPAYLPLGLADDAPVSVTIEDWTGGVAGVQKTAYFDEDAGDYVWDLPMIADHTGPVPYMRSTQTIIHGTGGNAMELGIHLWKLPPQCNDEVNAPLYEVGIVMKPYNRWPQYPAMATYNPATDSTFLAPCKIYVRNAAGVETVSIKRHDGVAINSLTLAQFRDETHAWNPHVHCRQMLKGFSHRHKLAPYARKVNNGMVPGTSNRPGMARAMFATNAALPALGSGYNQRDGFLHWFFTPPYPLSTTEIYPCTDPYASTNMLSDPDGTASSGTKNPAFAVGFMDGPGYVAGHDRSGSQGGHRSDRFAEPSQLSAYLTEPDGVRPQGNVPYKLLCHEYMKGYFNNAHHIITEPRTFGTLPHEEVAYGAWAYCNGKYTPQGPIFVAGGTSRHIDWFGDFNGQPPRDKDGWLPYHGAEDEALHAYKHPANMAFYYSSPAAAFSAMLYYNSFMMAAGANGSPYTAYGNFMMQREHAWRWNIQAWMWAVASSHASHISQAKVETRMVIELEFANTTVAIPATTPGHANYNNEFSIGLRNFGVPGRIFVRGDGMRCIGQVDDGKLLYLGNVLMTHEKTGFWARIKAISASASNMVDFVKTCTYTYAVTQMNASDGREVFWTNGQIGPFVPGDQPLVAYTGFQEWANNHAPVDGQKSLTRHPNGDPVYKERDQYQHLWLQTVFGFRDFLGGEPLWPGVNDACAKGQIHIDYYAGLIAGGYGGIFGDYERLWPANGIKAATLN